MWQAWWAEGCRCARLRLLNRQWSRESRAARRTRGAGRSCGLVARLSSVALLLTHGDSDVYCSSVIMLERCTACCASCCSNLSNGVASLRARWKAFVGRMSPLHSFLFQLLLLSLLVANVVSFAVNLRRLIHSYENPVSSLSVKRLPAPPPFTLAIFAQNTARPLVNDSLLCDVSNGEGKCARRFLSDSDSERSYAMLLLSGGAAAIGPLNEYAMRVTVRAEALDPGDCLGVAFIPGVIDDDIDDDTDDEGPDMQSAALFCRPLQEPPNSSYTVQAYPKFSVLQTIDGRTRTSLTVSTTSTQMKRTAGGSAMGLVVLIPSANSLPVQWETQFYAFTLNDLATSASSYFGISLTLIGFLFPWRDTFAPPTHREFRLVCKGCSNKTPAAEEDGRDDADEPQLEQPPSVQLRERMLA